MHLQKFIDETRETAIYPNVGANLLYPALGLAGEASEYLYAKHNTVDVMDNIMELGDVCWYVARIIDEAGLSVDGVAHVCGLMSSVHRYNAPVLGSKAKGWEVELVLHAGRVCETIKKMHRDESSENYDEEAMKFRLSNQIIQVLSCVSCELTTYGDVVYVPHDSKDDSKTSEPFFDFFDLLGLTVQKLKRRKAKGTLQGDGDKR